MRKIDNINRWCEEKGLSETDLKTAYKEYRAAFVYVRCNKNNISNNDARMIKRNEIIKRNKICSTHFRTKQYVTIKLEEISKTITIDNNNLQIGNTDLINNERCDSNESTEK